MLESKLCTLVCISLHREEIEFSLISRKVIMRGGSELKLRINICMRATKIGR